VDLSGIILGIDGYKSALDGYEPIKFGRKKVGEVIGRYDNEVLELDEDDSDLSYTPKPAKPGALIDVLNWSSPAFKDLYAKTLVAMTSAGLVSKIFTYTKGCKCAGCVPFAKQFEAYYTEEYGEGNVKEETEDTDEEPASETESVSESGGEESTESWQATLPEER